MESLDFEFNDFDSLLHKSNSNFFTDDFPMVGALSRSESTNTSLPFKVHLSKREPSKEIKEMFTTTDAFDELMNIQCEVISNSTTESSKNAKETKTTIVDVAIRMIEECKLSIVEYGFLTSSDKLFLANIVYIQNGIVLDTTLSSDDFSMQVNTALTVIKGKRNDDRLRFVYKRCIKFMLSQCSSYTANKLHKMENYGDSLIKKYFSDNESIGKEAMDTSFASKKKLTKLFHTSLAFKQDFMAYSRTVLKKYYAKYTEDLYNTMYKEIMSMINRGLDVTPTTLSNNYKRLPWRATDVQSTVIQICKISLD